MTADGVWMNGYCLTQVSIQLSTIEQRHTQEYRLIMVIMLMSMFHCNWVDTVLSGWDGIEER